MWVPGTVSRMSSTPWSAGSTPVRNDGHAAHEWVGTVERRTPFCPRSIRPAFSAERPLEQGFEDAPVGAIAVFAAVLSRQLQA